MRRQAVWTAGGRGPGVAVLELLRAVGLQAPRAPQLLAERGAGPPPGV